MGVENQQKDPEQEAGRPTRRSASDATSTLNNRSCCAYQRKAGASDSTTTTRQQKNCITQTHNKRTVDQNNPKAQRPEAKQCRRVGELISLGDRPFPTTPTDGTPSVTQPRSSPGKRGSLGNPTRELPGSSSDQDADPSWAVLPGRNKTSNQEVGDGTLPGRQAHQITTW